MAREDCGLDLMRRHRRLFTINACERFRSFGYPFSARGWRDLLDRLCGRIEGALRDGETIAFVQIKQKLAILRAVWDAAEASQDTETKIGQALALTVARSACTCEICGREGRLFNNRGWFETRCADDAVGEIVPPRYGAVFEDVRPFRRWCADIYFTHYDRERDTPTEVPSPSRKQEGY